MTGIRRRDFIAAVGSTAVPWPLMAGAQQSTIPVVGFLSPQAAAASTHLLAAVRRGLNETGFIEGQNVAIEARWAEGRYDRLPVLAAELIHLGVTVIVASAPPAALAVRAATSTVPIVFSSGIDPVKLGLVAGLNRPGGNITGVSPLNQQLEAKRLEILHALVPKTTAIAMLVNPNNPRIDIQLKGVEAAASTLGRQYHVLKAATAAEIDSAFSTLTQRKDGALLVGGDPFFSSRRDQLVALAAHYRIPAIYHDLAFVEPDGLMIYGASIPDSYRQAGVYAGRILKGEKSSNLPVAQATKIVFVINLKVAKALNLEIPPTLLALADEVIE
jgi:putative tryptophan/tyrosine transport system substrate-binding protein